MDYGDVIIVFLLCYPLYLFCCLYKWCIDFYQKSMDFIGREALMKQRLEGVTRMYVQLLLQDHDLEIDLWPWGGEPIYRDGKYVGATTTTGYGFTFKKQVNTLLEYNN